MSGDGTDRSAVHGDVFNELPELDDDSAHAAIVDYPWQFREEDGTGFFGNEGEGNGWSDFDQFSTEDTDGLAVILDECERVLVEGAWVFVFADDEVLDDFQTIIKESPLERRRTLVWDRCTIGLGQYFRSRHMFVIAATVGSTDRYVRDRPTVLEAARQDGFLREHDYPTGKPPALYRKMLASPVLEDGERLLEPFCGGAPGAAIATERGLGYWGCDVSPDAIDRAEAFFEQQRFGQTKLVPDGSGRNNCNEDTDSDQEGGSR
jgi:site-specific DNA-methyltransferase (adenine-specific)